MFRIITHLAQLLPASNPFVANIFNVTSITRHVHVIDNMCQIFNQPERKLTICQLAPLTQSILTKAC